MRRRTMVLVLSACAATAVVAGCSGDSGGSGAGRDQDSATEATAEPKLLANAPAPTLVPPMPWPADPVSQARTPAGATPEVTQVRTGRHAGYDRFSISVSGQPTGYTVRYVPAVTRPGSGGNVALEGQAFLEIVLTPAQTPRERQRDAEPRLPLTDPVGVSGRSISSYVVAGDSEGRVSLGVGVSRKTGFKVGELNRDGTWVLYVDIQHPVS